MAKTALDFDGESELPSVLVTGATGFVGGAVCANLKRKGIRFRRAVRRQEEGMADDVIVGDIGRDTQWRQALNGISSVIHLAARTHVMRETASNPLAAYRETNVAGTQSLAVAAADAGVKRFVFLSSVKVNGERTQRQPFRESDEPRPEDDYGTSKLDAERALNNIAARTGMSVTTVRSPLIYGPGVKGNLLALLRAVHKRVPLPLASIKNSRSLVYVENLASAIIACVGDSRAAGETFLVSDGEDMSTAELISRLAIVLETRPRLFPCPRRVLYLAGALLGRQAQVARLTDSLQVDGSKIRNLLGWTQPFSVDQGLTDMAKWFLSTSKAA